jgi:hypothetical protein
MHESSMNSRVPNNDGHQCLDLCHAMSSARTLLTQCHKECQLAPLSGQLKHVNTILWIYYLCIYGRGSKSKATQLSAAMYFIQQHWMRSLKSHIQRFLKLPRDGYCSLFIISMSSKMMGPVKTWSRVEVCSVVDCLHAEVTTANEFHWEFVYVYGQNAMFVKQLSFWCDELLKWNMAL